MEVSSIDLSNDVQINLIPFEHVKQTDIDDAEYDGKTIYNVLDRIEKNKVDNMMTGAFYKIAEPLERRNKMTATEMVIEFKKQFGSNGPKRQYGIEMYNFFAMVTYSIYNALRDKNRGTNTDDPDEDFESFMHVELEDAPYERFYGQLYYKSLDITLVRCIIDVYPSTSEDSKHVAVLQLIAWSTRAWLFRELAPTQSGLGNLRGVALPFLSGLIDLLSRRYNLQLFSIHETMIMTQSFLQKGSKAYGFQLKWFFPELPSAKIPLDKSNAQTFKSIWKTFNTKTLIGEEMIHGGIYFNILSKYNGTPIY